MDTFSIDIKNWLECGIILECVPECRQEFYTNRHTCRFVLQQQQNILAHSAINHNFFVIALKEKIPELKKFFKEAEIPCNGSPIKSKNNAGNTADITIVSEKSIDRRSPEDIRLFYQCLQYTIMYFCEENWTEIGESRGKMYSKADYNYLWRSKYLFDLKTLLVPAIEIKVDRYDLLIDDGKCKFEIKPLLMKKFPLKNCNDITINQAVFTLPRLTRGLITEIFQKNADAEWDQYNESVKHWKRTWGIQRLAFSECASHRFCNVDINGYDNKTYHIDLLFSKKPEKIESNRNEEFYKQFICEFKEVFKKIGNLMFVQINENDPITEEVLNENVQIKEEVFDENVQINQEVHDENVQIKREINENALAPIYKKRKSE